MQHFIGECSFRYRMCAQKANTKSRFVSSILKIATTLPYMKQHYQLNDCIKRHYNTSLLILSRNKSYLPQELQFLCQYSWRIISPYRTFGTLVSKPDRVFYISSIHWYQFCKKKKFSDIIKTCHSKGKNVALKKNPYFSTKNPYFSDIKYSKSAY